MTMAMAMAMAMAMKVVVVAVVLDVFGTEQRDSGWVVAVGRLKQEPPPPLPFHIPDT